MHFIRFGKQNEPLRIKKDNSMPKRNPNYIYEMATLPGDPREDLNITLGHDDVCGLEENGMLCMNLLDFILHSTCMHCTDVDEINYCLGGTITRLILPRWLMSITDPNADQNLIRSVQHLMALREGSTDWSYQILMKHITCY